MGDPATRTDALRRIVAEVSSRQDLSRLFEEVIDAAFDLFGVDRAGLWTYEDGPTPAASSPPSAVSRRRCSSSSAGCRATPTPSA